MGRTLGLVAAVALLLCAAATAAAREAAPRAGAEVAADLQLGAHGRGLLALNCSRVHRACIACRNQRIRGSKKTETVCSTCATGWRLRRDGGGKICDCAAGLALNSTQPNALTWCTPCAKGKYCLGGSRDNPDSAPTACNSGLQTVFAGAKSAAQCFTLPGHGRVQARGGNGAIMYTGESCASGLTTNGTGTAAASGCLAPAGSYRDRGVGKPCPKGTFTTSLNAQDLCTPCLLGVTTAGEGSTSAADCDRAVKGYSYNGDGTASPCELNTFNANETPASSCTPCPFGWRTQDVGATGPAFCLAPPGYELVDGNPNISRCPIGFWKEGWNRNPCQSCGVGLTTTEMGAVAKDACRVPAGYGLVSVSPLVAAPCTLNTYGMDVDRAAVASARCANCRPNLYTPDALGDSAPLGGYTSESTCQTLPGWGKTTLGTAEPCAQGYYNVGRNRAPCTPCPSFYTTLNISSISIDDCVITAGWRFNVARSLAEPCDKGTWSAGGNATVREPTSCIPCSPGTTTQVDAAVSASYCNICVAGHGGVGCALCPVNTFSYGGTMDGTDCTSCPSNTVSPNGAADIYHCYTDIVELKRDYLPVSDSSKYVAQPGITSLDACKDACRASQSCILLRYNYESSSCQLLLEESPDAGVDLSFKVKAGLDYVSYKLAAGVSIGTLLQARTAASLAACQAACTSNGNCEAVLFNGGGSDSGCQLVASSLDANYTTKAHVVGRRLASFRV